MNSGHKSQTRSDWHRLLALWVPQAVLPADLQSRGLLAILRRRIKTLTKEIVTNKVIAETTEQTSAYMLCESNNTRVASGVCLFILSTEGVMTRRRLVIYRDCLLARRGSLTTSRTRRRQAVQGDTATSMEFRRKFGVVVENDRNYYTGRYLLISLFPSVKIMWQTQLPINSCQTSNPAHLNTTQRSIQFNGGKLLEDVKCLTMIREAVPTRYSDERRSMRWFSPSLMSAKVTVLTYSVFYRWYVTSCYDLDLWPLDLERLQCISCHVTKLSTKFLAKSNNPRRNYGDLKMSPILARSAMLDLTQSAFS